MLFNNTACWTCLFAAFLVLYERSETWISSVVAISAVFVFMVALRNRADHYMFALWFLSSFFFPRLISAVGDWMSTILPHMGWPFSANLECMSEMCCTLLAKKSPFWHHRTTLSGCIFATEPYIDNRKKLLNQQYLLHMSS